MSENEAKEKKEPSPLLLAALGATLIGYIINEVSEKDASRAGEGTI